MESPILAISSSSVSFDTSSPGFAPSAILCINSSSVNETTPSSIVETGGGESIVSLIIAYDPRYATLNFTNT